jgi:hypothetical protein
VNDCDCESERLGGVLLGVLIGTVLWAVVLAVAGVV